MKDVYNSIRNFRNKKGFSQEYMAEKLGMNQSGYAKLEKGGTQLTIERLEQIAKIFEVDPIVFFTTPEKINTDVENQDIKHLQKKLDQYQELYELMEKKEKVYDHLTNSMRILIDNNEKVMKDGDDLINICNETFKEIVESDFVLNDRLKDFILQINKTLTRYIDYRNGKIK